MQKHVLMFLPLLLIPFSGCVSLKDYRASLADNVALKKENVSLAEELRSKEAEIRRLNQRIADLELDNQEMSNILKAKRDELNRKVAELRSRLLEREKELREQKEQVEALAREKEKAIRELGRTYDSLVGEMRDEIEKGEVMITRLQDRLSVSLVEKVLFDSGSARIKSGGKRVLDRVARILMKVTDKQIKIEGHTDNVPIGPFLARTFPTNWELSTARATTVARYLQDKGLDPALLGACGYSEYRPVASNETEEGRARNRRIEIALTPLEPVSSPPSR